MPSTVLLFSLDDLRARFDACRSPGADPRHDGAPFRAFRQLLLAELAAAAVSEAALALWWEGSFNGYALAVSVTPGDAVPEAERAAWRVCPLEGVRAGNPRPEARPLGLLGPGSFQVSAEAGGATFEAPFGAATGHFGAPGLRRITP